MTTHNFLLVLGLVLILIASCWNPPRLHLGWLGLFFYLLSTVLR